MPIYNGTQKVSVSGVAKAYVGTQLVYQKGAHVLDTITIAGYTTSLNRNAAFSFGGTVTANYSDGTTADVTSESTFSGYNMSVSGTYTVTVSYTEGGITATDTYSLTVEKIWTTIFSGTKQINAASSVPADWSAGIVKQSKYKFKITCVLYLKTQDSYERPHYNMVTYNPSSSLAAGQAANYTYTNTISSRTYTTNEVSASSSAINFFGLYGGTYSSTPSPSTTTNVKVKLVFALKSSSGSSPKFGLSYTMAGQAGYNEAYIKITKVEQYY